MSGRLGIVVWHHLGMNKGIDMGDRVSTDRKIDIVCLLVSLVVCFYLWGAFTRYLTQLDSELMWDVALYLSHWTPFGWLFYLFVSLMVSYLFKMLVKKYRSRRAQ